MTLGSLSFLLLLLLLHTPRSYSSEINERQGSSPKSDADLVEYPLDLAFLVAEFCLMGATGRGLDAFAPGLAQGGPPPVGGKMANLDPLTRNLSLQYGFIAVGHLRAIKRAVKGYPRPLLNISKDLFAETLDHFFGQPLHPPFDPYANSMNYRIACYIVTLVAPSAYAGIIPKLQNTTSKELVAGLLGVASGIETSNRAYLFEHQEWLVAPYTISVAEFTDRISEGANKLGKAGSKSEGIVVPPSQGAEGRVAGNVIEADKDSLTNGRDPEETLRIVYGSGDERVPGGFYPKGGNSRIAKHYLDSMP
ncbi:unnamed protein product [Sphenostylis stenocarpa]|uniref:Desiccation-related protein PCC13-62 n=1 Tax=Sphenostylis stenocarpa TaxID=92480 RepID=A0AA86SA67_9FABA|nr:unnamed protein product [Sphenostylis stenocarpa]